MKIIFITREGRKLPGARIRCYNFAAALSKYGINTQVLSFADTLGAKDGEDEARMNLGEKLKYNYLAFQMLRKEKGALLYLQRFNYHSFAPYLAHLLKKNKIILDLDDWEMRENPEYYFGFYPLSKAHYFTRCLARKSIICVAASRFLEKFLLQFNRRVHYIPSGVDTELFRFQGEKSNSEEIIFSWVGTLHMREYIENITFALNCFSSLRKNEQRIYFDIVGNGIYAPELKKIVAEYNDPHIRIKGWLAPTAIPAYLQRIHVGLLPAVRDNKFNCAKSPTKLFEYMAMAKPVVCSALGEAKNIIEDGVDGFLAHSRDDFIIKMQQLIKDAALRRKMGENARKCVENNYSLAVLGARLNDILKSI